MSFLDRFRSPRHPLLAAVARAERRSAKGTDHLRASTALLESQLFLATDEELDSDAGHDGVAVGMLSADDGGQILAAFLDRDAVRQVFPDARDVLSWSGAEVCRRARAVGDDALAVFAGGDEPAFSVPWAHLTWLGAGVLPNYQRVTGDHQALRDQGLVASCRRAVDSLDEIVYATLIEGIDTNDTSHAILMLGFHPDPSLAEWTAARQRVEGALDREGRSVPVVLAGEPIMIDMDTDTEEAFRSVRSAREDYEIELH